MVSFEAVAEIGWWLGLMAAWFADHPLVGLLLSLMVLDVASGLVAAFVTRALNSNVSWNGMSKKTLMLLLVALAALLEPFAGGVPLEKLVAGFYCVTEGLSVLENAGRAGVPLPPVLAESLQKLSTPKLPERPAALESKPPNGA